MAQNVVGHKEFIRGRQQVKGGGVRKSARGPKTCDLQYELATERLRWRLAILWHAGRDSNMVAVLGGDLPWRAVGVVVWSLLIKA